MNRWALRECTPILPWPTCPLAGQSRLGQNTVVGSMTSLLALLGNMPREVCLAPRFYYKVLSPRLSAELPVPDGPHKISIFPELAAPELATQPGKAGKEFPSRDAFEDLGNPCGRIPWRCREKHMDMIFHHLHGINLQIIRGGNLVKEILDRLGYLPDQQRLAVLGGPDDVILQVINGMGTCF